MFEKVSKLAEQTATNVSRRHFCGALSRAAAVSACALAGVLAMPAGSFGRTGDGRCIRCYYTCANGSWFYVDQSGGCKRNLNGCLLTEKGACDGR